MAVEFSAIPVQTVENGNNVLFTTQTIPCTKGYVVHRPGSGNIKLKGMTCHCRARYRVSFGANVAVPTDGTVGPVALALAIDGEADLATRRIVTPAAVGEYFAVSADIFVDVPGECCVTVSIKNVSDEDAAVDVQNANIIIDRVA